MSWSMMRTRQGLVWAVVLLVVAWMGPTASTQTATTESRVAAAAKNGDRATVRRLIAAKANVNAPERDGSTALLWAVYNGDVDLVKSLIAAGAKVDTANRFGVTPLLQASRTGETAIIETLLTAGANPKLAHPEGETPLMAAARSGSVPSVKLLMTKGADVNETDTYQEQTPLMWAAAEGHLDVVTTLLEAGAKPDVKAKVSALTTRRHGDHPTGGFTPLMWAARNGHTEVVKTLVKGGADINAKNGDNASAAIIAIANDRIDMASLLLDLGSDPNDGSLYFAVDWHDGTTDMRMRDGGLLRWDHPNQMTTMDLIKKLIDKGADVNKNFQGALHSYGLGTGENHNGTPFYRAAVASDVEVLKLLVTKGADLKSLPAPAAGGRGGAPRPAFIAASTGGRGYAFGAGPGFGRVGDPVWREAGSRKPVDAVKVLLAAGADANVQLDDDGNTALHLAATRNDLEMIRALADGKAQLDVYNWTGQTPIDIAEENVAKLKDPNAAPDPAVLAAMQAGTALPEAKATPMQTVGLLRQLLGWPALPDMPAPPAPAANTTATTRQGN